jgi:hypothetical protein
MDSTQLIGLVAPLAVTFVVQGLKRLIFLNGKLALLVVFVIGGLSAVMGIGPDGGAGYISTAVNAGWIVGVATFIYRLFFKKEVKL